MTRTDRLVLDAAARADGLDDDVLDLRRLAVPLFILMVSTLCTDRRHGGRKQSDGRHQHSLTTTRRYERTSSKERMRDVWLRTDTASCTL